jgi:hypothetical protein
MFTEPGIFSSLLTKDIIPFEKNAPKIGELVLYGHLLWFSFQLTVCI